MIAPRVHQVPL